MPDFSSRLGEALRDFPSRQKYLVGVSGGRDSMVLLTALHKLGYKNLVVCHLDHGMRGGASDEDAKFVRKIAARMKLRTEIEKVDTYRVAAEEKKSIELAARDERYAFFLRCARRQRCRRLFLAHHADDQVETVLFNFLRGTGAAGLAGMRTLTEKSGLSVIRPLLGISRAEVEAFAEKHSVPHREDASNLSTHHTRNRLRHSVLPAIEAAMGESFRAAVLRAAEILRAEDAWMESLIAPPAEKLSCRQLKAMPRAQQRRTVLRWLQESSVPEPGFRETERVLSLLNDGSGPAKASLPGSYSVRRRAGEIFLEKP